MADEILDVYLVWPQSSDRGDAKRVKAKSPEKAAKEWAEWADSWYADYTIINGQVERVFVASDTDDSEPIVFEVYGSTMPVYYAQEV